MNSKSNVTDIAIESIKNVDKILIVFFSIAISYSLLSLMSKNKEVKFITRNNVNIMIKRKFGIVPYFAKLKLVKAFMHNIHSIAKEMIERVIKEDVFFNLDFDS